MPEIALEMEEVSKKFKKGEIYDSLRDLIPALTGGWFRNKKEDLLEGREFWALRDVSFQVERGEAFGIIGHNGAGKSTILKHLSGIMKPTLGTIRVNGTLSALIEVGAGFHPDLTGRENIYLNGTILGMTRSEIRRRFDDIVEFSGLSEFIDTPVKRYSSGMYARLGFSVAAHVDPDILVVDEVLSVGDWAFQRKCMEKMNSVIQSNATVVFVSHNLRAVSSLCKRSLLLDHGQTARIGPTNEVIQQYLEKASSQEEDRSHKEVYTSQVTVSNDQGESVQFEPGEKAWVTIDVTARVDCHQLAIAFYLSDENYYQIFNTSTERLGYETFTLQAGETRQFTFELTLHLARGSFYLGVLLRRYDIDKTFDHLFPAATLFVHADKDVRGAANLYPTLLDSKAKVE